MAKRELLVTGFGQFGEVSVNPSALLARSSGRRHEVLEVSFQAVESFLRRYARREFDQLLMIGVADDEPVFRIELFGKNHVGPTPDVRGLTKGPGSISLRAPALIGSTLWRDYGFLSAGEFWRPSIDAGDYLCNYALFRALQRFPDRKVGFLHVPQLAAVPIETQQEWLATLLRLVDEIG